MFRSSKLAALLVAAASIAPLAIPVAASATATPDVQGNVLTITSDAADQITLTVIDGKIALNGTVTDLDAGPNAQITVNAGDQVDTVDASALTAANYGALTINGETGADILTGGGGNDVINGGDDVDELRGGEGNDRLTAGKGSETVVVGGDGDDTMVWNNGDGSDVNDGGDGNDTVESNGNDAAGETFTYEAGTADRVLFKRTSAVAFTIDLEAENLVVNGNGGDDSFSPATADPIADRTLLTVNGGAGADTITGADGADVINGGDDIDELRGGDGNDRLTGGKGNELVVLGDAGDDTMIWNGGDGIDLNDGDVGTDTVLINGAGVSETFDYEAKDDGRVFFQRTEGAPAFSVDFTAEKLEVNALAGDDELAPEGTVPSDALQITVNAGVGDDNVTGAGGTDTLNGEAGNDTLVGAKGNDTANGGDGDDTMTWNNGDGTDVNTGGLDNDAVISNGNETAGETFTYGPGAVDGRVQFNRLANAAGAGAFGIDLEAESLVINSFGGDDKFSPTAAGLANRTVITVNAGTGSDSVIGGDGVDIQNGGDGNDTLVGGKGNDTANGGEGDDTMTWNNGDGTDVNTGGAGNDTVISNGNDAAGETFTYGPGAVAGRVQFNRAANAAGAGAFGIDLEAESLVINSLGGDDKFSPTAAGLAGRTAIVVNAGAGNDVITGGDGADDLHGDDGDDQLFARDGVADAVHGDAGNDSAQTDALTLDKVDGVEKIDAPPVAPLRDTQATLPLLGKAKVTMAGKQLFAQLPLSCPATETGGCQVKVTLKTAKAVSLGKTKRILVLGSKSVKLAPGATTTAKVPLGKRAATVAKGGKLAVKALITSTDNAGNKASTTKALALKLPRAKK